MGLKITDQLKEEIRTRNRLEDVIGAYVTLKRSGKSLTGLCPFHNEKTPSFSVSPTKQFYYCFGCGASGDVFDFVMQYERLDFVEAVKRLAERAGIVLEMDEESVPQRQQRHVRDALLEINRFAAQYFRYRLMKSRLAAPAREYLSSRGVSAKTQELFSLGYALDSWDDLSSLLAKRGFPQEIALESGLVKAGRTSAYDVFRDRIIFPIRDVNGRVIGFGGRILASKGDSQPKYINSSETPLFNKRRVLYGIDVARDAIRRQERAVIVEGYMDVIACHQNGFDNVVASLGTSLTKEQAGLLARYAPEVIILYDADTAGQDATLRGLDLLRTEGLRVKVVTLAEGEDPDSFLRKHGSSELAALLESAANLTEYRINAALRGADLSDASLKAEASRRCIAVLAEIADAIERSEYSKYAAFQLGVDEVLLSREVERAVQRGRRVGDTYRKNRHTRQVKPADGEAPEDGGRQLPGRPTLAEKLTKAELLLLALVLDDPGLIALVRDVVREESFSHPAAFHIYQLLSEVSAQGGGEAVHNLLLARINDEDERQLVLRLSMQGPTADAMLDPRRSVVDCALRMEEARLSRRISDLQLDLRDSERNGDADRSRSLRKEIMDHQRLRQETRARMSNPNAYHS